MQAYSQSIGPLFRCSFTIESMSKRIRTVWILVLFSCGLLLSPGGCIPKRLAAIGGMGTMLSPSAKHMVSSVAKFEVVHLRASAQADRIARWKEHGAKLVEVLDEVLDADVDALLLCVGKMEMTYPFSRELVRNGQALGVQSFTFQPFRHLLYVLPGCTVVKMAFGMQIIH